MGQNLMGWLMARNCGAKAAGGGIVKLGVKRGAVAHPSSSAFTAAMNGPIDTGLAR